MKRITITALMVLLAAAALGAQDAQNAQNAQPAEQPWAVNFDLGASAGGGEALGSLGASISREVTGWLDLGLAGHAFYDIEREYEDISGRSYHMESGYLALRIRPKKQLTERWEIAIPWETGRGILVYRYDSKYAKDLRWTDETLDQLTYGVNSLGIENRFAVGTRLALWLCAGYRATSPLRTDLVDSDALSGPFAHLGLTYRF